MFVEQLRQEMLVMRTMILEERSHKDLATGNLPSLLHTASGAKLLSTSTFYLY